MDFLKHKDAWRDEKIYKKIYEYASKDPVGYWAAQADRLSWSKFPKITYDERKIWFPDGRINACYNCVDRHAEANPDKTAIIWQSEDINIYETISFQELQARVSQFANTLKMHGLTRKEYITIYMPMVPEGIISCLACARLGIPYTVVFAGFSPNAIALRMQDCSSKFIISCDANRRGGRLINLKNNVDEAREILGDKSIRAMIIRRQNADINWNTTVDIDYYEASKNVSDICEIADTASNDDLFILYTSGSVGKPKGILQGTGGFLLFSSLTHRYFFDIEDDSIFWGSGDIGWMGGHAYSLYSALCNGVTAVIYEGIPTYPRHSMFAEIIDKHKVSSLNTAPTAIRAIMQYPIEESLGTTTRESLRTIGVMGEVLNKDAWLWYYNEFGNKKCNVVNMWGQTELGGVPTAPLCNHKEMKTYGHIGRPFFGCNLVIKDDDLDEITRPEKIGTLYIKDPMPGMLKSVYGDENAVESLYYNNKDHIYYTGDEAYYDYDGYIWITGRVDDVLNVSGHRVSPIEIEEVITEDDIVHEASVVGYPHPIKGEGIYAFVVLKEITENPAAIISKRVSSMISPISKPDVITFVDDLPKTRSGKIMRRILRKIAAGSVKDFEDITTIQNPECVEKIIMAVK